MSRCDRKRRALSKNAVDELERVLALRKAALDRYSASAIRAGIPMSELANTLVPVFLMHRYQTEAAAKTLGGVDYNYALRGDNQTVTAMQRVFLLRSCADTVFSTRHRPCLHHRSTKSVGPNAENRFG